jgi:hypothetical protein
MPLTSASTLLDRPVQIAIVNIRLVVLTEMRNSVLRMGVAGGCGDHGSNIDVT